MDGRRPTNKKKNKQTKRTDKTFIPRDALSI